jgi:hypothetical protein
LNKRDVFDGDDGLGCEVLHQFDLLGSKGANLLAINGEGADEFTLLQHRHNEKSAYAGEFDTINAPWIARGVSRLCGQIRDMNERSGRDHSTRGSFWTRMVR